MLYNKDLTYPVAPHPTWDILDPSKLNTYLECERMFFFEYVLGWRQTTTTNHLHFGSAHHEAMELLTKSLLSSRIEGVENIPHLLSELTRSYGDIDEAAEMLIKTFPQIDEAFQKFLDYYRADPEFGPDSDEIFYPKTPAREALALLLYTHEYAVDFHCFELVHSSDLDRPMIEFRIQALLEDFTVCGKVDALIRNKDSGKVFVLEHKTGTPYHAWDAQWEMNNQPAFYSYFTYLIAGPENFGGVIMNGVLFNKRMKKNAKKDADDPFRLIDLERSRVYRQPELMRAWYWNVFHRLCEIQGQFEMLADCSASEPALRAFPMREKNCTSFYGRSCPYLSLCKSVPNPLAISDSVPSGLHEEWWNPLEAGKFELNLNEKEGN